MTKDTFRGRRGPGSPRATLLLPLALLSGLALAAPAELDGPVSEGPEHARLREAALHDMYADADGRVDPTYRLRAARFTLAEAKGRRALGISGSRFTSLGPTNAAGRVSALAVHPTDPRIVYRGTAGGGVWKTTDGGTTWQALTDEVGDLSIGALALDPSHPETVYVGTGEGANAADTIDGLGLMRSTDGGATWLLPSTVAARRFYALSVNPTVAGELVAATTSGLLFSSDGGETFAGSLTTFTATALVRDPSDASTLVAATHYGPNGSRTGAIHRSTDGGRSWTKTGAAGTPPFDANVGRLSLAVAQSEPATLYALAAAANGNSDPSCTKDPVDQYGVFRSTDGGLTWTFVASPVRGACGAHESILFSQGWYANTIVVDPTNPRVVYAGGLDVWKSSDGGLNWEPRSSWASRIGTSGYVHADIHALTWAGAALWVGNDGGVEKSADGGASFASLNTGVVTRQYYSVAVSGARRGLVLGGAQDNGTNLRLSGTTFKDVLGGDGFGVAVNPTAASEIYASIYFGVIYRSVNTGGTFLPSTSSSLYASSEKKPFITPLTMDPNNPSILYTGSNLLYHTTDAGGMWSRVSTTDLGDGASNGYLTKIAVSRSDSRQILTATGAGIVKKSTDAGLTWSAALTGGLPARYASHVEFDPTNAQTFYVAYAGSSPGDRLFRTTDGGATFKPITTGLPPFPLHVLRVDPTDASTLYAGTDVGLYRSTDAGAAWSRFGTGLPAASVWDIALLPDGTILRVATHGRGMWELEIPSAHVALGGDSAVEGAPQRR